MLSPPVLELSISPTIDQMLECEAYDTKNRHQEARLHLSGIRRLLYAEPEHKTYYRTLVADIAAAIFGSRQLAGIDATKDETDRLCHEVFRAEVYHRYRRLPEDCTANEAYQHSLAFKYLADSIIFENVPWTDKLIKNTHAILFDRVNHSRSGTSWLAFAGKYRNAVQQPYDEELDYNMQVGDAITSSAMVPSALNNMLSNLNNDIAEVEAIREVDPFWLAAKYSVDFLVVRPFSTGNGRMSRLILNVILLKYVLVVVPIGETEEDRKAYLEIKKRVVDNGSGVADLAAFIADRSAVRLKCMKENMEYAMESAMADD